MKCKANEFPIKIIQGDTFRNVYRFYSHEGQLITNEFLESVYFTCSRLNYVQALIYDEDVDGWILYIPSNTTKDFTYCVTNYDLTLYFIANQITTQVYRSSLQILKKDIIYDKDVPIIDNNYYDNIITDVQTNIIFTGGTISVNDYNDLINQPSINGITLLGNKTSEQLDIVNDKTYVHTQYVASSLWEINHNLNKYPSVTIVDSGQNVIIGEIEYVDSNNVIVQFNLPFSGEAYLN